MSALASPLSALASPMSAAASLVEELAGLLQPVFHGSATAAAIVLLTMLVRLAVHPLSRAAARGQQARVRLAPRIAELRKRHARDPERMQRAVLELHTEEKVSPLAGCLPSLAQAPAFLLMFHLFSGGRLGDHTLLAAPLGGRWTDALAHGGLFGPAGLVYLALFAIVAAVGTYTYRRGRRDLAAMPVTAVEGPGGAAVGGLTKVMPLLGYATLITVAVVPLAAALYVVTSTAWTAAERAYLYRGGAAAPVTA